MNLKSFIMYLLRIKHIPSPLVKKLLLRPAGVLLMLISVPGLLLAENIFTGSDRTLQHFRTPDKNGINVFEDPKSQDTVEYDGFNLRIGAANTMKFQALEQSGSHEDINDLSANFNLPTANLDIDVQLHKGLRMHLRSWMTSQRQGPSLQIKGGYIQMDRMDFIQDGFLDNIMDHVRLRIGHLDFNYGDAHFRRSDNAHAIHNPFVGNYIMDAYTNELGGEMYVFYDPFFIVGGMTNSRIRQTTLKGDEDYDKDLPTFFGKIGYDSQINPDLRVRLSGSVLTVPHTQEVNLYSGDRAGGQYYNILNTDASRGPAAHNAERFSPDFYTNDWAGEMTSFQINPFVKFHGFEFFGTFEHAIGQQRIIEDDNRSFTQMAADLLYRFGKDERFYLGGRYNLVSGEMFDGSDIDIDRINAGGGFFMTENVLMKAEYVMQSFNGFPEGSIRHDAKFDGIVLEAIVSF